MMCLFTLIFPQNQNKLCCSCMRQPLACERLKADIVYPWAGRNSAEHRAELEIGCENSARDPQDTHWEMKEFELGCKGEIFPMQGGQRSCGCPIPGMSKAGLGWNEKVLRSFLTLNISGFCGTAISIKLLHIPPKINSCYLCLYKEISNSGHLTR